MAQPRKCRRPCVTFHHIHQSGNIYLNFVHHQTCDCILHSASMLECRTLRFRIIETPLKAASPWTVSVVAEKSRDCEGRKHSIGLGPFAVRSAARDINSQGYSKAPDFEHAVLLQPRCVPDEPVPSEIPAEREETDREPRLLEWASTCRIHLIVVWLPSDYDDRGPRRRRCSPVCQHGSADVGLVDAGSVLNPTETKTPMKHAQERTTGAVLVPSIEV